MTSEKTVEQRLCKKVKELGGKAIKFTSQGMAGTPDRIVLLPGGRIYFVELKRENGRLSPIQTHVFKEFGKLGCEVRVLYGNEMVDEFIREMSSSEI